MPTLYIVRHDPKAWKNGRRPTGVTGQQHDPPLADPINPSAQLRATIEQLKGVPLTGVLSSPFLRTRQTTNLISQALDLTSLTAVLLPDIGEYLGNQRSHALPDLDAHTAQAYGSNTQIRKLTSEGIKALEFRTKRFLKSLPTEGTYLVVTHGLIAHKLCGQDVEEGALYIHRY